MYANVGHVVFESDWEDIKVSTGRDIVMMFPNLYWTITFIEMNPIVGYSDWLRNLNT